MKKVSIVVPCYNEEATVKEFHKSIVNLWHDSSLQIDYEPEMIFIDDGSSDRTLSVIEELRESDHNVRYTSFSRNFGKEAAIFCGLKQATGDAVIVMDADLQHPPEVIPRMLAKWSEGYDIVEGIKSNRGKENPAYGIMAGLFYRLISKMVGFDMAGSSDFKLMDRKVADSLNCLSENTTFFRALSYWVGFRSASVEYDVAERIAGKSKWSRSSLFKYAISNMTSFTYAPLYIIGVVGGIIFLIGLGLGIDAVVTYFIGKAISGYPSLVILITLATGGIMLSLGIIAVYIAKMYNEIKGRPRYIINDQK